MIRGGKLRLLVVVAFTLSLTVVFMVAPARAGYRNMTVHNNTGTTKYDLTHVLSREVTFQWELSRITTKDGGWLEDWPRSGQTTLIGSTGHEFTWGGVVPDDSVKHCEYVSVCLGWRGPWDAVVESTYWTPEEEEIPDFSLIILFVHYLDCTWKIIIIVDCVGSQAIITTDLQWAITPTQIPPEDLYWGTVDTMSLTWNSIGSVTLNPGEADTFETGVEVGSEVGPYIIVRSPVVFASAPGDTSAYVLYEECASWPTYVELTSFDATGHDGYAEVEWTTATELDNAGFNLYHSLSKDAPNTQLNTELIPAQGDELQGASYSFTDEDVTNGVTYYYWLEDVDLRGNSTMHGPVSAIPTSVEEREEGPIPAVFSLAQNYPNPFNATTAISYQLSGVSPHRTTLKVYNIAGQEVRTLVGEEQAPGYYSVSWDGRDGLGTEVSSGIYFYRLKAGSYTEIRKMVLLK